MPTQDGGPNQQELLEALQRHQGKLAQAPAVKGMWPNDGPERFVVSCGGNRRLTADELNAKFKDWLEWKTPCLLLPKGYEIGRFGSGPIRLVVLLNEGSWPPWKELEAELYKKVGDWMAGEDPVLSLNEGWELHEV